MPQVQINFLAVAVARVVAFIIGGLWYSPLLFASCGQGSRLHGRSSQRDAKGRNEAYAVTLVCDFLIALAIAGAGQLIHMERCVQGLKLGLLIWAGFAFPLGLIARMFSGKRFLCSSSTPATSWSTCDHGAIITVWR